MYSSGWRYIIKTQSCREFAFCLVNDPLPGLFMSSWFLQNRLDGESGIRNVGVYTGPEVFDEYEYDAKPLASRADYLKPSEDASAREKARQNRETHIESTHRSLSGVRLDSWCMCFAKRYFCRPALSSLSALRLERKNRAKELREIRELLITNNIDPTAVFEIWSRDTGVDRHFIHLCPNAKLVFFEHGISDVRNCVLDNQAPIVAGGRLGRLPNFIKVPIRLLKEYLERGVYNFVEKYFLYFSTNCVPQIRVSLLADEIAKGKSHKYSDKKTLPGQVLAASNLVHPSGDAIFQNVGNSVALILLMIIYPKPWGPDARRDQLQMLRAFEDY